MAILKGKEKRVGAGGQGKASFNTIIGNKTGDKPFHDEVILQKSSQVLPLARFDRNSVVANSAISGQLWSTHQQLQKNFDEYFNDSKPTKVHRVMPTKAYNVASANAIVKAQRGKGHQVKTLPMPGVTVASKNSKAAATKGKVRHSSSQKKTTASAQGVKKRAPITSKPAIVAALKKAPAKVPQRKSQGLKPTKGKAATVVAANATSKPPVTLLTSKSATANLIGMVRSVFSSVPASSVTAQAKQRNQSKRKSPSSEVQIPTTTKQPRRKAPPSSAMNQSTPAHKQQESNVKPRSGPPSRSVGSVITRAASKRKAVPVRN